MKKPKLVKLNMLPEKLHEGLINDNDYMFDEFDCRVLVRKDYVYKKILKKKMI